MKPNILIESITGDKNFEHATGITIRENFDSILKFSEEAILSTMSEFALDESLELFDIGLRLCVEVRSILDEAISIHQDHLPYLVLSSKIVNLMIAIRKIIRAGLPDAFKCIFRPLTESIDTFYVCIVDKDFRQAYGNVSEMYDNNEFWYRNAKYDRIKSKIHRMFTDASGIEDQFNFYNTKRKEQQKFLSESLHSSFNAAFATYFTPTIKGELPLKEYGNVTTAYPAMVLNLLEEISIFNYVLHHVCVTKRISSDIQSDIFTNSRAFMYLSSKYADLCDRYLPLLNETKNSILEELTHAKDQLSKQNRFK
ncbi:hypothetical protein [Paenibacillus xylanexedens]|uniref:hypothetical protein n=1 Tax=Paenibacillus xylanexedens TaxID=528191 RepID=UPI001C8D74C8|nr:hypothetical protein [Paenibacillus xylanexedens]MBY0118351.1 hypothetical protein [Paenibacillus xylanexedens]